MKSNAQRKADERARMRALGFVPVQYWVHVKDRERVDIYVRRVAKRRLPKP